MKHLITTTAFALATITMASAEDVVLYENNNPEFLSWSTLLETKENSGLKGGDKLTITISEVQPKADCEWPQVGIEKKGASKDNEKIYPEELKMHDHRDVTPTSPYNYTYTLTNDDANLLKGGFVIKVNGVKITKVVYTSTVGGSEIEEYEFVSELRWNDHKHPFMHWDNEVTINKWDAAGLKVGDKILLAINRCTEETLDEIHLEGWFENEDEYEFKIGFEKPDAKDDSEKWYPERLNNIKGFSESSLEAVTIENDDQLNIIKGGFVIKGRHVNLRSVVFMHKEQIGEEIDLAPVWYSEDPVWVSMGEDDTEKNYKCESIMVTSEHLKNLKDNDLIYIYLTEILDNNYFKLTLIHNDAEKGDNHWDSKIAEVQFSTSDFFNAPRLRATGETTDDRDYTRIIKFRVTPSSRESFKKGFHVHGDNVKIGKIAVREYLATGVDEVENNEAEIVNVYNMQGVLVRKGVKASEATAGLPAGLYIAGSRKVLVK